MHLVDGGRCAARSASYIWEGGGCMHLVDGGRWREMCSSEPLLLERGREEGEHARYMRDT
jgi:hypothetical protein